MRRACTHLFPLISILLLFSSSSYGQAWSGVLAPSRAIDWSHAGLPASLPDGETTSNPWTPPTRTQCVTSACQTVTKNGASSTVAQINAAIASAPAGTYVLLPAGSYTINAILVMYGVNNVTLRGSGPMQTILSLSSGVDIEMGASWGAEGSGLLTSGSNYAAGSTSIKIGSLTGTAPVAGRIAWLSQCDTGTTRSGGTCTGTQSDNGSLYVCGDSSSGCAQQSRSGTPDHQQQTFLINSATNNGDGTYTISLSPTPLYMPNWAFSPNAPILGWPNSPRQITGVGLEDLTVSGSGSTTYSVSLQNAYASWIKGVRFIGSGSKGSTGVSNSKNSLVVNNYLAPDVALTSGYHASVYVGGSSDVLVLNNIVAIGIPTEYDGGNSGVVTAYNYGRDAFTSYAENGWSFDHAAFSSFDLYEANQSGMMTEDDIWGTHALNTYFRNYISCYDTPYTGGTPNPRGLNINGYQRFENAVGNAIGTARQCDTYQGTGFNTVFQIDTSDSLVATTLMRWGNVSVSTQSSDTPTNSGVRFVSNEVPSSLPSPNSSLSNPVPSNDELPASFFMNGMTAHPSGGTGLNWWKVCSRWTTFPTSCASYQTQPFPTAGPDVSGGLSAINGYAYDIPAAVAWQTLPIDTAYQNSYAIQSSSWSSATETLTFNAGLLPNTTHLMGGFELSGVPSACNPSGGELLMTDSTSTTVSYGLTANPGTSCTGTMKFPDVRQFDERVYQNDSGGAGPFPPTGLSAIVQ
jgi:hypothetical protein